MRKSSPGVRTAGSALTDRHLSSTPPIDALLGADENTGR
jgi:hypothetical protein